MMSLADYAHHITRFCRTGEIDPTFEFNRERLNVYLEHVRKKIKFALKRAFPLAYCLLTSKEWDEMTEAFLAQEECSSPFFWTVPKSFVDFVKKGEYAKRLNIPYLEDLLDFEWIEIEMYRMPDLGNESVTITRNVLDGVPHLNPESRILKYSYPVFEKKPLPRPMNKGSYYLLAFRHPKSKQVHFISLSSFFCVVVQLLAIGDLVGREILNIAADQFQLDLAKALIRGEQFLNDLISQGVICGFKE